MRQNNVLFAGLAALGLLLTGPANAADVVGKWFSQTGSHVITIYKAGPQYAASLPVTEGVIPAGSPHASPGKYRLLLSNFSVSGRHVHFLITQEMFAPGAAMAQVTSEYDLNLSPEGQRLMGTQKSVIFHNAPSSSNVTLFLRN